MTEYVAQCNVRPSDSVTARHDGASIELEMRVFDEYKGEASLTPAKARTFARGILALADEIDGGEAEADSRPQVGDRLRVTADNPHFTPVKSGDVITVVETDYDTPRGEDCVRFQHDGDSYRWFIPLTFVEPAPLADWEHDLVESASTPAPIKVGDRVEIVRAERCSRGEEGRTGIVTEVDKGDDHLPYRVVDDEGVNIAWAAEVRRTNEPANTVPSAFASRVNEAKTLLADIDHTGADVVALAVELDRRG